MRVAKKINLTNDQFRKLNVFAKGRRVPVRVSERAKIILLAAQGKQNKEIADVLGIDRITVSRWRSRFIENGVIGIEKDATRPGRKKRISKRKVNQVVEKTLHSQPANATHWSARTLAKEVGLSPASVHRIWQAHALKPHLTRTFKLSNDKRFIEKLEDIVGLYLSPPEHAIVLSCDEKSQIQALDRTQPGLPLKKGRCGTMTHDYKRNGTTTLFAALNILDGRVMSRCMPRHRHIEWLKFLRQIDREISKDLEVHLIADNYATHKHHNVRAWLEKHPRFHMHFTPTSASWLNAVERFFREITDKQIRRGCFTSVKDLVSAIEKYIDNHNEHTKPFKWTATVSDIVEKVSKARKILDTSQSV